MPQIAFFYHEGGDLVHQWEAEGDVPRVGDWVERWVNDECIADGCVTTVMWSHEDVKVVLQSPDEAYEPRVSYVMYEGKAEVGELEVHGTWWPRVGDIVSFPTLGEGTVRDVTVEVKQSGKPGIVLVRLDRRN